MKQLQCQIMERTELTKTPIFSVEKKVVLDAWGKQYSRVVVKKSPAVVLIPRRGDGTIVLVRQWRAGSEQVMLELPAGVIDEGETPRQTAEREIREEIGCRSEKLQFLGSCFVSPGYCSEQYHFFLAEELVSDPLPPDDDEHLEVVYLTLEEAIENPEIRNDSKSWLGVLAAERFLHQNRDGEVSE